MTSEPFAYTVRAGHVTITYEGSTAAVLRGTAAERFLRAVARDNPQLVMARVTGNFKRGNERKARRHPRNRSSPSPGSQSAPP